MLLRDVPQEALTLFEEAAFQEKASESDMSHLLNNMRSGLHYDETRTHQRCKTSGVFKLRGFTSSVEFQLEDLAELVRVIYNETPEHRSEKAIDQLLCVLDTSRNGILRIASQVLQSGAQGFLDFVDTKDNVNLEFAMKGCSMSVKELYEIVQGIMDLTISCFDVCPRALHVFSLVSE